MKLRKEIIITMFFMGIICVGCSTDSVEEGKELSVATSASVSGEETGTEDLTEAMVTIHVFTQEDMIVTPAINEYDFAIAQETMTI